MSSAERQNQTTHDDVQIDPIVEVDGKTREIKFEEDGADEVIKEMVVGITSLVDRPSVRFQVLDCSVTDDYIGIGDNESWGVRLSDDDKQIVVEVAVRVCGEHSKGKRSKKGEKRRLQIKLALADGAIRKVDVPYAEESKYTPSELWDMRMGSGYYAGSEGVGGQPVEEMLSAIESRILDSFKARKKVVLDDTIHEIRTAFGGKTGETLQERRKGRNKRSSSNR